MVSNMEIMQYIIIGIVGTLIWLVYEMYTAPTMDDNGNITEIHCTYIPESKSGHDTSGINVKGTIHWVNSATAVPCEVRLYDRLFHVENPAAEDGDFKDHINPHSLEVISNAMAEPSVRMATAEDKFQFMRKGYFCLDTDSTPDRIVFNRTVQLKDSWSKQKVSFE